MYTSMRLFFTTLIFAINIGALAQTNIQDEAFEFSFVSKKNGGQFLYNGKQHSFTIDITSDSIQTTEYPNYIIVGKQVVQTSLIPLPETTLDLVRLTTDQQKEALNGYVDYEMDYFKNELKLSCQNLKKEWTTFSSKIWLVWSFDVNAQSLGENVAYPTKSQIYASTICFNQVLDLNVTLFEKDNFAKSKELINKLMSTLKLSDKRFNK